jgi:hypothetical protein
MTDMLQKVRQEYSRPRLAVQITLEDLNMLIERKMGLSLLLVDGDPTLYTKVSRELANLAALRQSHLEQYPAVEVMPAPDAEEDDSAEEAHEQQAGFD